MILRRNLLAKKFIKFPKIAFSNVLQKDYLSNIYKKHSQTDLYKEKHDREFEVFLNKMEVFMDNQTSRVNKVETFIYDIERLTIVSREPIKEILACYAVLVNDIGYDSKALSYTCNTLGKAWQSRANFHRTYTDYTPVELLNSYRMYYLLDDLKFAISNNNSFFNADDIVLSIKGLTMLKYKSNELVELISDKLDSLLNNKPLDKKYERYADIPGSGRYSYLPKNQFAEDILKDSNFKSHLGKLMRIQIDLKEQSSDSLAEGVRELISHLKDAKELQYQFTDTIDNLTEQYIQIEQTLISNPDIASNPYIKYELYKLQDKLIESGYLTVDTILKVTGRQLTSEEVDSIKYENTIKSLRDNITYNFPELFSKGSEKLDNVLSEESVIEEFEINKSRIDDSEFSKILSALVEYAQVLNVDVGEDFKNEKITNIYANKKVDVTVDKYDEKVTNFKYEYTKLYNTINSIFDKFDKNINDIILTTENPVTLGNLLYSLNMINRTQYNDSIANRLTNMPTNALNNDDIIITLLALARSNLNNDKVKLFVSNLSNKLDISKIIKAEYLVKVCWALATFGLYNNKFIEAILIISEGNKLLNYITNIKDDNNRMYLTQLSMLLNNDKPSIPNDCKVLMSISHGLLSSDSDSNSLQSDPVKDKLIKWIENSLYTRKQLTQDYHSAMKEVYLDLPYKPDILFGHYGTKIGLFLLDSDINRHSNICTNIGKILSKFNIKAIFLNKTDLLSVNLSNLELTAMPNDFKISDLVNGICENYSKTLKGLYNKWLSLTTSLCSSIDTEISVDFLSNINEILDKFNELSLMYTDSLVENKLADLKILLLKTDLIFSALKINEKDFIDKITQENFKQNFKEFVSNINTQYSAVQLRSSVAEKSNSEWFGKRLTVDLLKSNENIADKNISIELLNNNYLWFKDYNTYSDWEVELRSNYDNFNYFIEENKNKYLYNSHKLGNRNVPFGIFPHPTNFRKLTQINSEKEFSSSSYENELKKYKDYSKYLIANELEKNKEFAESRNTNPELMMKVNLLNVKNALKQNLTDNQIVKFISEFEFIDKLIEEHLSNKTDEGANKAVYVKRDPKAFISFHEKLGKVRPMYDEYDKTVMKEYYKESELFEYDSSKSGQEIQIDLEAKMKAKVDETVDMDALSIYAPNVIDYKFDIDTVLASHSLGLKDPKLEELKENPEEYLKFKRLEAERNFILFKIVTKLLTNSQLSENEKNYLNTTADKVNQSNLLNIQNSMIRTTTTALKLSDLAPNDIYQLNTLPNVDINESLNNFSLSDLILELNSFIDNNTVQKVLYQSFEKCNFGKFNIPQDYKLFKLDNKEPTLLAQQIKENIWRMSSKLNEDDIEILKRLLRVKRGKGKFDDIWLELDELSLEHFIGKSNNYDDRLFYLAKWIKLKEKEIENRVNLPSDNMVLSDTQINSLIQKKNRVHRKNILLSVFKVNDLSAITSKQLNQFINKFCSSLALFNFDYPENIIELYYGLLDCPNITEEDKQMLTYYRFFFKLDTDGSEDYLAAKPIELNTERIYEPQMDNIEKQIKNANIDFIKPLVDKIFENIKH
jgi:hypothetical protein